MLGLTHQNLFWVTRAISSAIENKTAPKTYVWLLRRVWVIWNVTKTWIRQRVWQSEFSTLRFVKSVQFLESMCTQLQLHARFIVCYTQQTIKSHKWLVEWITVRLLQIRSHVQDQGRSTSILKVGYKVPWVIVEDRRPTSINIGTRGRA